MGVSAFVRRARALELALKRFFDSIAAERRARMLVLFDLARRLDVLAQGGEPLPPNVLRALETLRGHEEFARRTSPAPRSLKRALRGFEKKLERFNRRWSEYLDHISIEKIHTLQRRYNKYYPLEREFALRGAPPMKFEAVPLLERDEIRRRFPVLG